MNLVYLAALITVCSAANLDRTYLPPASSKTAGGNSGDIQTPLLGDYFNPGQIGLPKGAVDNEFDGVVVEAAAPGTRASSRDETGLGGSRITYGSTHSKVGEAAFKTNQQGFQPTNGQNTQHHNDQIEAQTFQSFNQGTHSNFNTASLRPQSGFDRASNIVRFENTVGPQAYNFAFETENGIIAQENGVNINGVQVEGGFSYTGDDGKLYKVTYTADEGGYQPTGDHLPTPPPIPDEILKSLEQNANEAAAGLVDDGSYDAAKYNAEGEYTKSDSNNGKYNGKQSAFGKRPASDTDVSGTFINQNNQAFDNLNGHEQFSSSLTSKDKIAENNFGSFLNNNNPRPILVNGIGNQHLSQSELEQNHGVLEANDFRLPVSDKKIEDEVSSEDDFSRPIFFGSPLLNQAANNGFGIKQSYITPNNYNSNNRQAITQSLGNSQSGIVSPNLALHDTGSNLDQQRVGLQSRPHDILNNNLNQHSQISKNLHFAQSHSQLTNGLLNNILNRNLGIQSQGKTQSIPTFNTMHATLQPSTELTTPFEDFPDSEKVNIFNSRKVSIVPTQASLTTPTSNSLSHNVAQTNFVAFNNNYGNRQLNPVQQDANSFHEISESDRLNLSHNSQYQGPDNSYYYNQPSKPFNTNREKPSSFVPVNSHFANDKNTISTKYPRPPTVAPLSFASQSERFPVRGVPSTKFPEPPTIGPIAPTPTSPTEQDISKFPLQYTGITQASVSPFPSISSTTNTGSSSKTERLENSRLNEDINKSSPSLHQEIGVGQLFNQPDTQIRKQVQQTNNQVTSDFNKIGSQLIPSQQYDGEIYEYKKPVDSLSTSAKSEEKSTLEPGNNFPQFGQKLQSSSFMSSSVDVGVPHNGQKGNQNEFNSGSQTLSFQQGTRPLIITNPKFGSLNFQEQFSKNKVTQDIHSNSDLLHQQLNSNNGYQTGPSSNMQTISSVPTTQTTQFTSGVFSQSQTNYNPQFEFSSRIRPCCQGPRTSSAGQNIENLFGNPTQQTSQDQSDSLNSTQFELQSTALTPTFPKENLSIQSMKGQQELQSTQATSQTFQAGAEEEFGGPRRPPSFDEVSGYHY